MAKLGLNNIAEQITFLNRLELPFIWFTGGIIIAIGFLGAGFFLSPYKAFMIIMSLPVCFLIFVKPEIGLYMTVFAIPLENLGRFTQQGSIAAVSIAKILGFVTLVAWISHVIIKKKKIDFSREFIVLTLFWLVALTTLLHTSALHFGINRILSFLATFSFYLLIINLVKSPRILQRVLISLLIAHVLVGLFAIAQRFVHSFEFEVIGDVAFQEIGVARDLSEEETIGMLVKRSGGTSGSPHVYSAHLLVAIPLYFYFSRFSSSLKAKIASVVACALSISNLFLTHTRAGIIVFFLALILLFYKGVIRLTPARILVILVALAVLIPLLFPFLPDTIQHRLLDPDSYTVRGSASLETRLSYWKSGIQMLKENWLLGMGIGNFKELPKYNDIAAPGFGWMHNIYLQMFNEVGIFGFSLLLFFLVLTWRNFGMGEKGFRARGEVSTSLLSSTLKICFISIVIIGLSMDVLHLSIKDWWLVTALSVYLRKEASRRDSLSPERAAIRSA